MFNETGNTLKRVKSNIFNQAASLLWVPQNALRLKRLSTLWSHWLGIGAIGLVDQSTCAESSDYETHDESVPRRARI